MSGRGDGIRVRAARESDAAVIAEFNRRLAWESEGRELDPGTLARGVVMLLSDPSHGQYWVAESGDGVEPVGQCLERFREADHSPLPVRVGEREVGEEVVERLA